MLFAPSGKGRQRQKKGEKGRLWPRFPGRAARHPLSPHLLHPHLRHPNKSRIWGISGHFFFSDFGRKPESRFSPRSQARKRHININFFVRLVLDFTGFVPGTSRVCPRDKSGENLGQPQGFSLFYTVEARFHRVCPRDKPGLSLGQSRGRREAQEVYVKKSLCAFFPISGGSPKSIFSQVGRLASSRQRMSSQAK